MITPNYDPSGLSPKILIHDLSGTLQYTYESDQIAITPTKDFKVESVKLHLGINDDYGNLVITINSS